jgi:replicative DNA helicase
VPELAWWSPKHRDIAAAITARLRAYKAVDPNVILSDLLARAGTNGEIGPYLITLMQRAWSPDSAPDYAERILHCAARRDLSAAAIRLRKRRDQSWINGWGEPGRPAGPSSASSRSATLASSRVRRRA